MKIRVHRSQAINLKLFLDMLGFVSVWGQSFGDIDYLNVLNPDREALLKAVEKELNSTGYLPYHYLLSPQKEGMVAKGERAKFTGDLTQVVELKNVSGEFRLALFEDGTTNWLWKTYSNKDLPPDKYDVTGKIICKLKGFNGENFMLFNYGRVKIFQ